MDYTAFFLSAVIMTLAAIHVYQSDLRMDKQEKTVLQMEEQMKEQKTQIEIITTKNLNMKEELKNLKVENLNMKEELKNLKVENLNMKEELKNLKVENLNMKEELKNLKVEISQQNQKLQYKLKEDEMKAASVEKVLNELKTTKAEKHKVENDLTKINKNIGNMLGDISTSKDKGVTYVRWGKTVCDGDNTETVYTGQVGGGHYTHKGTSVNYICLPNDPEAAKPLKKHDHYAYLYGAEYEIFDYNKPEGVKPGIGQHDVACAVCLAKGKATALMIPGRKSCYTGWKSEYNGYLMGGYHSHASASEYACVDKATEAIPGGSKNEDGRLFYPVKTQCGSLKCPPYTGDTEVLCVVCTK